MFLWKIQISVHEKDTILLYVANNLLASSVRSAVWSYHTIKINANEYIIFHTNNWVLRICFGLNSSEEIQTLVSIPTCCVIWIWLNASNFSVYWGVAAQKKKKCNLLLSGNCKKWSICSVKRNKIKNFHKKEIHLCSEDSTIKLFMMNKLNDGFLQRMLIFCLFIYFFFLNHLNALNVLVFVL